MTYLTPLKGLAIAALMASAAPAADIRVANLQFNPNMHPLIQVNNTKLNSLGYLNRAITGFDENQTAICFLCEEVATLENGLAKIVTRPDGSEGMEVTLRLREGAAWGDGTPVTSADILFTWEMARDPKIGFSNYNPWTRADTVEVVDDRTVVLHLPQVVSGFESWDHIVPEHLERTVYEAAADAESYINTTLYNREPTNPGLWNGPFVPTDWRPGTAIVLVPNPHWPGDAARADRIIISFRDNTAALQQNLLADAFDLVYVSPNGINFSQFLELRDAYPDRFQFIAVQGENLERLNVNFDNPALADVNVRKALLQGIDRQTIVDVLFQGLQNVAHGPLAPVSPFHDDSVLNPYPYDPEAARALLAEAGWTPGPDGICTNAAGERLSLTLITTAGNRTREQLAQVMQDQLGQICIEVQNQFVELREFSSVYQRERRFDGLMLGSIQFPPSTSPRIVFGSDQIPSAENNFTGNNFSGFRSEAMDAAVGTVETDLTFDGAKAGWREVQRIFSEELPLLPLYNYAEAYVLSNGFTGFVPGTISQESNWSEHWAVE